MDYIECLKHEMIAAFGCTEPIALAYSAARAREVLGSDPDRITARLSGNMIKNANSVKVPGTQGRKGIAFIKKEEPKIIEETLSNALAVNSGLICDGAKPSCAMKIASSLRNAMLAYEQAKEHKSFEAGDGIVMSDIEHTIAAVSRIAKDGMKSTDEVILDEMIRSESKKPI